MLWNTLQEVTITLGWSFYGPVLLLVLLAALGVPVWVSIGAAAALMLHLSELVPPSLIGQKLFSGIDAFALTAIPLFVLTGDVLVRTGISRKFLNVAEALTCWTKGGFGSATVLVCGMFSAISGSDAAGAAAVGRMTIDRLVESASGAGAGILIPPSIAYIVIGLVLGISVPILFAAAVIPGLLVLTAILTTNIIINRRLAYEGGNLMSFKDWLSNLGQTLADGWYAFIVPGIIFVGIFSGQFTPTEAGATAVVTTMLMGFLLGTLRWSDFPSMLVSSAKVNGVIVPIIAFAIPLGEALAVLQVPQGLVYSVSQLTENYSLTILLMIGILILAGCVMETTPNIVILAPLLHPIALNIGMNEIQFCIMMITALGVGFITPPLGLNLFVVSGLTGESILPIARRAVPFVFFMLMVVLVIAFVPWISTVFLPETLK